MLVKTKVGPSVVHGLGLFAAEFIPKGTPVWEFTPDLDLKLTEAELGKLSLPSREQYINHARFFNHSDTPNVNGVNKDGE